MIEPDILLLDEPLSNLDAKLRQEVRVEIRELQKKLGLTTVMVTHDQDEALTMADRLVVMSDGQVQQVGSQRDLYEQPGQHRSSRGSSAAPISCAAAWKLAGSSAPSSGLAIRCRDDAGADGRTLALRPERAVACRARPVAGAATACPAPSSSRRISAASWNTMCACPPRDRLTVQAPNSARRRRATIQSATGVHLHWPAEASLVLADDGGGTG